MSDQEDQAHRAAWIMAHLEHGHTVTKSSPIAGLIDCSCSCGAVYPRLDESLAGVMTEQEDQGTKLWATAVPVNGTHVHEYDLLRADVTRLTQERDTLRAELGVQVLLLHDERQENARLTAEQRAFTERCHELRNGSPNAFYSHVDTFCKAVSSLSA